MSKKMFVHMIGRFGNCLFIYAHARAFAEKNGYTMCIPPWCGEQIFNIPLADRTPAAQCDIVLPEDTFQRQESLIYTRKQAREWFTFRPEVLEQLRPVEAITDKVLLNLRAAPDYVGAGLVQLSPESIIRGALAYGYKLEDMTWEDDLTPTRLPFFTGNEMGSGLGTTWVGLPSFYRLMRAPVLFRANSSFSWWAATLGQGKVYSPMIKGVLGGVPDQDCPYFVEGNWPMMANRPPNTDLHLAPFAIEDIYAEKCAEVSDINEHLPTLRRYASECQHVTEFGVRGIVSTWALIAGRPKRVISYDISSPGESAIVDVINSAKAAGVEFAFIQGDTRMGEIERTDLLFIDTSHTYTQLKRELDLHASKVGKYIILHDTTTFGEQGEQTSDLGLLPAMREFLSANPQWQVAETFTNNNGLTVLKKT